MLKLFRTQNISGIPEEPMILSVEEKGFYRKFQATLPCIGGTGRYTQNG
jgi:hypothetical protein